MLQIVCGKLKTIQKLVRHFSTTKPVPIEFEENKIIVKDSKNIEYNINYVRRGDGRNAMILMPGALGTALTDFGPQIEQLPDLISNYSIIGWDPPGYGKSRPPNRTFDLDFFHRDAFVANALMQSLGLNRYSVLGWSDGGITGMIMAANYQDSVHKLVIWGSNSYILPEEMAIYKSIRDVSNWSARMREPMEKVYGVEYFPKLWSEWIEGMENIYEKNGGNICKDDVTKIEAETLILHGNHDKMIAAEHIPYLRRSIKNTSYYDFPHGQHNIHLRYAEEFNEIVVDFLLNK